MSLITRNEVEVSDSPEMQCKSFIFENLMNRYRNSASTYVISDRSVTTHEDSSTDIDQLKGSFR